ncbi:flavin-dependent monooxygenase [Flindersiella endophytica]
MDSERRAVVVGAGIGGLAVAGGLATTGWQVTVLERATELRPLGSGLALWRNALTALDHLAPELAAELRKKPTLQGLAGLRTADGRWVGRLTAETAEVPISVGRPELYAGLRACVPEDAFRFGRAVESVRETPEGAIVHAIGEHGAEEYEAELVVAADGIGSRLRRAIDPRPKIRSAGYISWRGMVPPRDTPQLDDGGETWGLGQRFGMNVMSDGGVYWYATLADADPRTAELPGTGDDREHLLRFFAGWHDPIRPLIERTPQGVILRHDTPTLWPLPRTYVSGRLALLGDAAHAMTPDLGQGACQALEDAVELAGVVRDATGAGIPQALRRYDSLRRPRTTMLAKRSRLVSRFSQLRNPIAAGLRNGLLRIAGLGAAAGGFEAIVAWQPGHGSSRD